MHVVDMVAVLDGLMATARTVLMLGDRVFRNRFVLVVVVTVQGMVVGAVDVVHVVAVLDGLVAAARTVLMLGDGVLSVNVGGAHDVPSHSSSEPEMSPVLPISWTWATASPTMWVT
jgi:hypothetical protein